MNNDLTITRLPTLCNPEKLTPKELREQYLRLEEDAIRQGIELSEVSAKLHQMNCLAQQLSSVLYALCDSYEAGDQAAILLQVKKLAERRIQQKAKVH